MLLARRLLALLVLTTAALAPLVVGRARVRAEEAPGTTRVDSVRDIKLPDLDGKDVGLSDVREAKALVLASPCGFEQFMSRWATPRAQSPVAPPIDDATIGKLMVAAAEFGLEMRPDHKPMNAPVKRGAPHKPYTVIGLEVDMRLLTEDTRGGFSLVRLALEPESYLGNFHLLMLYQRTKDVREPAQNARFEEIKATQERKADEFQRVIEVVPR